ncbi:MAG: hypothetical protein A2096_17810 [Spirochaetes bacterium GWF1_41_5]|nr:MAG: hypothetical protein A2096_17810 [Spirochaetes bacterium GWF1_41_5]
MVNLRPKQEKDFFKIRTLLSEILFIISGLSENTAPVKYNKKISYLAEYINNNYFETQNLKDLADRLQIKYSTLSREFHKAMGVPFVRYISRLRLEKSAELLRKTEKSIISICFETGFNDVSHFNRVFRQKYGVTPGRYRKTT